MECTETGPGEGVRVWGWSSGDPGKAKHQAPSTRGYVNVKRQGSCARRGCWVHFEMADCVRSTDSVWIDGMLRKCLCDFVVLCCPPLSCFGAREGGKGGGEMGCQCNITLREYVPTRDRHAAQLGPVKGHSQ